LATGNEQGIKKAIGKGQQVKKSKSKRNKKSNKAYFDIQELAIFYNGNERQIRQH
jgi:hypothetical protein